MRCAYPPYDRGWRMRCAYPLYDRGWRMRYAYPPYDRIRLHGHCCAAAPSPPGREQTVELVGEGLSIARREGRRPTGLHAAVAQLGHEIAQR